MRMKAAMLIIAVVIAITAANYLSSLSFTTSNLDATVARDQALVRDIAASYIGTHIELLKKDAIEVATELLAAEAEEDWPMLMQYRLNDMQQFMAFSVFSRNGVIAARGASPAQNYDERENAYLERAFNGEGIISTTLKYPGTDILVFYMYLPMDRNRVLVATLRGSIFTDMLEDYRIWDTGTIYIIDEEGTFIAHYDKNRTSARLNYIDLARTQTDMASAGAFFNQMILEKEGTGSYSLHGQEFLCSFKHIQSTAVDWVITVVAPLSESPWTSIQQGLLVSAFIFIIAGLLVAFFLSIVVARPFERIEAQNVALGELNKTVSEQSDQLQEALDIAQKANEAKSDFLAKMSHEMRTPLNAIIGLSMLALEDDDLNEDTRVNVAKVNSAGSSLLSTVNDILDISKIEAGKYELNPNEYYVASLINDVASQSSTYLGNKHIKFKLNVDEYLPRRLYGDDLRIKQVLNNLLSNAFKYTKEGSVEFDINCTVDGEIIWLTACIRDSGIGIKIEDIGNLFEDYTQMDSKKNTGIIGTGLGLPIVKRLVEMMQGTIVVESEYGKGSTFRIMIPQKTVNAEEIGPEMARSLSDLSYSDVKRQGEARLSRISLPYARVLVVDDFATNLDVARGLMKPYGMKIDCVTSGQEAIDAIMDESMHYDAVFMDHMMPGMDGIEAARHIREIDTDYAKNIPVIALTANAIVGSENEFLDNGFQAFISKPIDVPRLDAVIREWIHDEVREKEFIENLKKLREKKNAKEQ